MANNFGPIRSRVAFLRPGEKVQRVDGAFAGSYHNHPTRPFDTPILVPPGPPGPYGWPNAGESWEEIFGNHPLEVRFEAAFPDTVKIC